MYVCDYHVFSVVCVFWVSVDFIASVAHCLAVSGFGWSDCGLNDG